MKTPSVLDDLGRQAFLHAPVGILFARNRVILECNLHFAGMFGWDVDELRDQSLQILYPSSVEFDRIEEVVPDQFEESGTYWDERIMRRKSGDLFWCRVRGKTLDTASPFENTIWTFADISDLRPTAELSARERQVAEKLAQGMTAKEIARDIDLSYRTVEIHRASVLRKLNAKNSLELVAKLAGFPFAD